MLDETEAESQCDWLLAMEEESDIRPVAAPSGTSRSPTEAKMQNWPDDAWPLRTDGSVLARRSSGEVATARLDSSWSPMKRGQKDLEICVWYL